MKKNLSIQLKAFFLLVLFGSNMAIGLVCALGIDDIFSPSHHHSGNDVSTHVHANGKKHIHGEQQSSSKDDCCNEKVAKLSLIDKAIPQADVLNPAFFIAYIASFYNGPVSFTTQTNLTNRHYCRNYHPPIPDIRIAIRSFQI